MIASSRWSLRDDQPRIIPHRAARPRTPALHLEWHVAGVKVSRHRSVTSAMLARPEGGVLMVRRGGVLLPWTRGCA